jgi:hypothetical protein
MPLVARCPTGAYPPTWAQVVFYPDLRAKLRSIDESFALTT